MTKYSALVVCLSIFFCSSALAWNLDKEEEGIRVYTQKREGSNFKAFRADITLDANLRTVTAQLVDVDSMEEWLHDCAESELLGRLSEREYYVYQKTSAPWPVADRDYIFRGKLSQNPESLVVKIDFNAVDTEGQTDTGCVRVVELEGFWRMTPLGPSRTYLEYETHADPAGILPSWLANAFVVDQPFYTLKNLRERISHKKAVNVEALKFIEELKD